MYRNISYKLAKCGYKDVVKSLCDYYFICHRDELPAVNCRTCAHASPMKDGLWDCRIGKAVPTKKGCTYHLYNPNMLNFELLDHFEKDGEFFINISIDGQDFTFSRSDELREKLNAKTP